MGCYDQVRFADKDYVLPDSLVAGHLIFQTKDLGGNSTLLIDFDGSIILDDLWRLFWDLDFDFYAIVDGVWHEYHAHFESGILKGIEVV